MSQDIFRNAQREHRQLFMAWVTLGLPYVVEQMADAGYDVVLIDQQHGVGGHAEMVNCLTAARAAGIPALVRPVTADAGLIGQALDAGAQGVVCPLIETAEDADAVVRAVEYPPRGLRSWGPYAGKFLLEGEYFDHANDWSLACVQIETRGAVDNLDGILATDGLDMALVGPNDLAAALTGKRDIRAREVVEAIDLVLNKTREHDVIAAIYANDIDYAKPLVTAGWDIVTIGTDMGLLADAAGRVLDALKS
jgi:4-hydroxy-2-oxoheptanedioate aldolase